jgi:hypothetical protein
MCSSKWPIIGWYFTFVLKLLLNIHKLKWSNVIYSIICNTYEYIDLILYLLMWRIWWSLNNASEGQMVFNSAFKGQICFRNYKKNLISVHAALWVISLLLYPQLELNTDLSRRARHTKMWCTVQNVYHKQKHHRSHCSFGSAHILSPLLFS